MADLPERHTSHAIDAEMRAVREQFASMAARCSAQVHRALEAFWTGAADKRAAVEAGDEAIDADEKSMDALLLRVLALRHPVASDLRTLTALFKLVTDLERIGDEAVDIARGVAPASTDAAPILGRLRQMAETSEKMFESAVSSFLKRDAAAAEQVRAVDGVIDDLYDRVLADAVAFMSRVPKEAPSALASLNAAKGLRRIADHAKNIAEGTLFVVRADEMPC